MVMVESLACGTPVVTRPMGAAPEIVEDGVTGFLCATPRSTCAAIEAVGDLDRSMCRQSVAERFSIERMVNGYLDVYEKAIAQTHPRSARLPLPAAHDRPVLDVDSVVGE
jgi:glycosyltransferase involved in cell wall biosynthesis